MHTRWARVARGVSAAAFATFVAALSHQAAGGTSPTLFGIGVSLVISAMLCTILAGRSLSIVRLTVSVAASQALFHAVFSGLGTPVAAQHVHVTTIELMDAAAPHHSTTMWLAHIAAGLVTLVALRHAESAFWGLARTASLLVARLVGVVIPVLQVPRAIVDSAPRFVPRDLGLLLSPMRHRGPPALAH